MMLCFNLHITSAGNYQKRNIKMSRFASVEIGAPIEGSALKRDCMMDDCDKKVDLTGGIYRSDEGKSRVFPIVRRVKKRLASDVTLTHEYLPVLGLDSFTTSATEMLLGSESLTVLQGMEFGVHCIGSTGALRVGAEFLNSQLHYSVVYYSSPSLDKHRNVFIRAGFSVTRQFRYWKANTCTLDMEGLLNDLGAAPKNSVVLLQVCGHNPTGIDPTKTEWAQIADVMEKQQLFPFFDSSSQGLASGDIEADAWPVRYFANRGFEFMCAQSFSINFGLYNERVGNLVVVVKDLDVIIPMKSQFSLIVSYMCSSPSSHGARIVATILNNHEYREEWKEWLNNMSKRIIEMRQGLQDSLERLGTPGKWNHFTIQKGIFSYTELTPQQVEYLIKNCHIYLTKNGCINICGLNTKNLSHVANSINEAVMRYPKLKKEYEFEKAEEVVRFNLGSTVGFL